MIEDLEAAQLPVWRDASLSVGTVWWREILHQIREAGVFLHALSDNSRTSEPCNLEREYADALGVPVLPVQVGPITSLLTWPNVFEHQLIDYPDHVVQMVAGAFHRQLERRLTPTPLPPEPDPPFAYLRVLRQQLDADDLDKHQQRGIVWDIKDRLETETDLGAQAELVKLLVDLGGRTDGVQGVMKEVANLLREYGTPVGG